MSFYPFNRTLVILLTGVLFIDCSSAAESRPEPAPFVPVFQHMLEHWEAEPYDITVHHHGPLADEHRAAVERLQDAQHGTGGEPQANLAVRLNDHAGEVRSDRLSPGDPPLLDVRYPAKSGMREPIWQGALTTRSVEALLQSPAREQIADALAAGKAGVWVLLKSADEPADALTRADLERELDLIAQAVEASGSVAEDHAHTAVDPIDTEFAIVEVDRDDPAEQILVRMLMHMEPDLSDLADQPMVFPVYGRGIAMYALVGGGIHAGTLRQAAEFLMQDCATCQIESIPTGVELLLSANWTELLGAPSTP